MATDKKQVSFYPNDALLASLNRLSKALGKSRASTVTWVLSEFQQGMDQISNCLERVEDEKKKPVSELLKIISKATYLIEVEGKNVNFPLLLNPESEHDFDD